MSDDRPPRDGKTPADGIPHLVLADEQPIGPEEETPIPRHRQPAGDLPEQGALIVQRWSPLVKVLVAALSFVASLLAAVALLAWRASAVAADIPRRAEVQATVASHASSPSHAGTATILADHEARLRVLEQAAADNRGEHAWTRSALVRLLSRQGIPVPAPPVEAAGGSP